MSTTPPLILTIAGSDSSSGAGVQADIKTTAALGVYATSLITNITAQNTKEVTSAVPMSRDIIRQQFEAVVDDFALDAIKIGLLGNSEVIEEVANCLASLSDKKPPVVLDPVLGASSGASFLDEEALDCLKTTLFPLCDVITPNISEAERLLDMEISSRGDMEQAARECLARGYGRAIVLTGGEGFEEGCVDMLFEDGCATWFEGARINTPNSHGTGCTFSTALACHLAKGSTLHGAVVEAKKFVRECLVKSADVKFGGGSGPLLHGFIK